MHFDGQSEGEGLRMQGLEKGVQSGWLYTYQGVVVG